MRMRRHSLPESTSALVPSKIVNNIHSLSTFSSLSINSISNLLGVLHFRRLQPGEMLIEQNSRGKSMFLILNGKLQVIDEGKEVIIAELGEGDIVGEIGVIFDISRTASVRASPKEPCTVGTLQIKDLVKLKNENYKVYESIWTLARDRYIARNLERFQKTPTSPLGRRVLKHLRKEFGNIKGYVLEGNKNQIMSFVDCEMSIFVLQGSIAYHRELGKDPSIHLANHAFHTLPKLLGYIEAHSNGCKIFISGMEEKRKREIERLQVHPVPAKSPSTHLIWSDEAILSAPKAIPNISQISNIQEIKKELKDIQEIVEPIEQLDWLQFNSYQSLVQELIISKNKIKSIKLDGCWYANDFCIETIRENCSNSLKDISLQDCLNISEQALVDLFNNCHQLRLVNCSNCSGLSEKSLHAIEKNVRQLEHLNLSHCHNIGLEGWESIGKMTSLQELIARRCPEINTEVVKNASAPQFTNLSTLDLSECCFLSNESMIKIVSNAPKLSHLNLSFCQGLTANFPEDFILSSTRLESLNISFTLINEDGIKKIVLRWPNIKVITAINCKLSLEFLEMMKNDTTIIIKTC